MAIIRLFLVAALLLMIAGCFKKDSKSKTAAKPASAAQSDASNVLFEEFFDGSSAITGDSQPQTTTSASANSYTSANSNAASSRNNNYGSYDQDRPTVRFSSNGRYVVQITTVASLDLANQIAKKLERQGYPVYVAKVENPTTSLIGTYYRVRIGGFDGIGDARYFGEDVLKPLGYEYWVDNKSNDSVGISGSGLGNYYPQAVDYNSGANHTPPANQTQSAHAQSFEVEPQPQAVTPQTTSNAAPAAAQNSDNNWDNFEW